MTGHFDPPDLVVHALRQAQHLRHAAVDGIGEFIGAAGDRAPSEVGRKHARRIRAGVSDSATARQGDAKVQTGRCSGTPAPGLSCLRLPDPTNIDCLREAWRGTGQSHRLARGWGPFDCRRVGRPNLKRSPSKPRLARGMRQHMLSPNYTTSIHEIPKVRC